MTLGVTWANNIVENKMKWTYCVMLRRPAQASCVRSTSVVVIRCTFLRVMLDMISSFVLRQLRLMGRSEVEDTSYSLLSLPIETINRELYGKVLLALMATTEGWAVLIGKQSRVCDIMKKCPPGTHLEISIPDRKYEKRILPLYRSGHTLSCLCEEGMVYNDGKGSSYCDLKVGINSLKLTKIYFANGIQQESDIKRYRDTNGVDLVITGNPRFDILKNPYRQVFEDSVVKIKKRIGDRFVLVNTSFAIANPHPSYGNFVTRMVQTGRADTPEKQNTWKMHIKSEQRLISDYQYLITKILAMDIKVVIRPHPSEDHNYWKRLLGDHPGFYVIHEGSANSWILASTVVIHSGCTTGIEAFLLGRQVIAYVPEYMSNRNSFANRVSDEQESVDQVLNIVQQQFSMHQHNLPILQNERTEYKRQLVNRFIANSDEPYACERIIKTLSNHMTNKYSLRVITQRLATGKRSLATRLIANCIRLLYKHMPHWVPFDYLRRKQRLYLLNQQKFPGLSRTQLTNIISCYVKLGVSINMPSITAVDKDVFLISPSHNKQF